MTKAGVVFLDRDQTIVQDSGYLHDPAQVVLMPNAAQGIATLAAAGWPLVVVSNQSGIGRGMFRADAFHAVMDRIEELLAPTGVRFLARYFCPHRPDEGCECRKPGVALFRQAAAEHNIALGSSWFLGDRWRDVQPAMALGGRGIVVNADPLSDDVTQASRHGIRSEPDLLAAARLVGARR